MIESAKQQGATDRELHDTVLIAALFSLYNRYVDRLATVTPSTGILRQAGTYIKGSPWRKSQLSIII